MVWSRSVIIFSLSTIYSPRASSSRSLSASKRYNWLICSVKSSLCRSRISLALVCSYSLADLTVSFNLADASLANYFLSASKPAFRASSELSFSVSSSLYFLLCSCTWDASSFAWAFLRASMASLFAWNSYNCFLYSCTRRSKPLLSSSTWLLKSATLAWWSLSSYCSLANNRFLYS